MKEVILYPVKIVDSKKVENEEVVFEKKEFQIGINEHRLVKFNSGSYLILDFGKELKGALRLLTFANSGSKVRVRYGESVMETCSSIGEKNATNDHSCRDFYIAPPNYSDQVYINSGFRFVRIDVEEGELFVKSILVQADEYGRKPVYTYTGKDELVKKIFETAKRTVSLCACSDYVWDGIKRDRLVWYGDLHPETIALATLYGKTKQIENSVNLARKEYPLPYWMNNFPSYSMWWTSVVCDYYELTCCRDFTEKQLDYLTKLISQMNDNVLKDGTLNYPQYFTDWPTAETPAAAEGVRAINILAVKKAIKLFKEFGADTKVAEELLKKLLRKDIVTYDKKQIIALKCLALGKTEREDYEKLTENGSQGFSTFMSYYILSAIAAYDKEKAIDLMKEYFGKMLELGATTFWEDFDITWAENSCRIDEFCPEGKKDIHGDFGAFCYEGFRHSFCHGWSSGIVKFIHDYCK